MMKYFLFVVLVFASWACESRSKPMYWGRFVNYTEVVITGKVISAQLTDSYFNKADFDEGSLKVQVLVEELTFDKGSSGLNSGIIVDVYSLASINRVPVGESGSFFLVRQNDKWFTEDHEYGAWPIIYKRIKAAGVESGIKKQVYDLSYIHVYKLPESMKVEINELVPVKKDGKYVLEEVINKYFTVDSLRKHLKKMQKKE